MKTTRVSSIRPLAGARSARLRATFAAAFVYTFAAAPGAHAEDFFVPSVPTPTIQDAVDDAALNADPENFIYLGVPVLFENVTIGGDFDAGHRLTIAPDGGAGLVRASVSSAAPNLPVFALSGAPGTGQGWVTLQDLDIVRAVAPSSGHLVTIIGMSDVVVERCRIGLETTSLGLPGSSNLQIAYPTGVVVRNCIFFALAPGSFDHAVHVINMSDPANSVLFYNNLAASYRVSGFRISDGASAPGAIVLLRNNVAVNHPSIAPEPFAYRSEVDDATVVSSHNVAFASVGSEESVAIGAAPIGTGDPQALRFAKAAAATAFTQTNWTASPPWNVNPDFFRLDDGGPLHDDPGDFGATIDVNGVPHAADVANLLDIEREGRPGGDPKHTDRGPDQLDPAEATDVGALPEEMGGGPSESAAFLHVAPERNPARDGALHYAVAAGGRLTLERFDVRGRRLEATTRFVAAGDRGVWRPSVRPSGVALFRAVLQASDGRTFEAAGKIVGVR